MRDRKVSKGDFARALEECMAWFTREVLIPPLLRATRGRMQRTPTRVLRAKTHHRLGLPYRATLPALASSRRSGPGVP